MTIPAIRLGVGVHMAAYAEISVVSMTAKTGIQTLLKFPSIRGNIGMVIPSSGMTPIIENLHMAGTHIPCRGNTDRTVNRNSLYGVYRSLFSMNDWPESPCRSKDEKSQNSEKEAPLFNLYHHPPLRNQPWGSPSSRWFSFSLLP